MKFSDFKIDTKAREEGEWVDLPSYGMRIKTRGAGNKAWSVLIAKLYNELPRHRRSPIHPDDNSRISAKVIAETALLDWEGPMNGDGEPLKFSPEQAYEFLSNPEYGWFLTACQEAANAIGDRLQAEVETTAKN